MMHHLRLDNFKCFIEADVELTRLNVFAGANGAGKSTILQALLVLYQSFHSGALKRQRLELNGPLIELGTGRDVLYKRSESDVFGITVADESGSQSIGANVPVSDPQHTLDALVAPPISFISSLQKKLLYLSADRLAPQKLYPMNLDEASGNEVGRRGEFAPLLYSRVRTNEVSNELLLLEGPDKRRFIDLESQFTLWMGKLFPGFNLRADVFSQLDSVMLGLNLQKQIGEPEFLRPPNVGFGVLITFPVILVGLLADRNTTVIIENPEAHLHPSAQSTVGEFLARVAAGGAQVFIETHSDHVVNGIRIAHHNEVLSTSDVGFFAFSKTDEYGSHRVSPVRLGESGDFAHPPEFFFDQADKDLKLIYGI